MGLDELAYGIPSDGPYQTNLPSIEDIISSIRIDRDGQVRRIRHEEEFDVLEYQVLTHEIEPTLKPLEEIIRENVFLSGGNRDHVPACLCYMLYCVVHSKRFNLAYFMAKRMEWVTKQKRLILPYGMLLIRLFKFIVRENPELENESYVLYDRVMNPLAAKLERKPRRDRDTRRFCHSTSSSSAFDQQSSSHLNDDDDDGNDKGTSCASTPSPIRYVNSLTNLVPQLAYGIPSDGPYQTNPPSIEDIISSIRIDREGQVRRIRHKEEIDVLEYQILTREIMSTLKPLEEIIRENIFCLRGNRDHVPACLCFMLYCVVHFEKFNLSYYMAKRMEWVTKQARLIIPYGMILTRLFKLIMNEYPELYNESYVLYDRVMDLLAAQLERKVQRDLGTKRGRPSTSSSTFDQSSSSHLKDDDDDRNNEGTSRASTPSPIRYVNSLTNQVPQVF
ncbi:hypothetical protein Tco_0945968, partial [Tanacetum coccineum]